MTYPHDVGFQKHSAASREAARTLKTRDILYAKILEYLTGAGNRGAIVDEAKDYCETEIGRTFDRSTVAARFTELMMQGAIFETPAQRQTPRKRPATVYVHKDYAPAGSKPPVRLGRGVEIIEDDKKVKALVRLVEEMKTTAEAFQFLPPQKFFQDYVEKANAIKDGTK